MPQKGERNLAKEQYWRDKIAEREESGLTKTEFCKKEGIKLSSLCTWETVINQRDHERRLEERNRKRLARQEAGQNAHNMKLKREKALKNREQFWRKALSRFVISELSIDEFCAKEGLYSPTFSYWIQVLLEREPKATAVKENVDAPSKFVPVLVSCEQNEPADIDRFESKPGGRAIAELSFAGSSLFLFEGIEQQSIVALLRAVREVSR